jgi:hypothetical protein
VLALVFDDFREVGVRQSIEKGLRDSLALRTLAELPQAAPLLSTATAAPPPSEGNAEAVSLQTRTEAFLTDKLSGSSRLWALREQARGSFLNSLYRLRNTVFGISAQSTRRRIPSRYAANREAVEGILADARSHDIMVFGYIGPLRNDVKTPYDPKEYQAFLDDMEGLFGRYEASFRNLERLVPGEYWGTKNSTVLEGKAEIDFMHFQAPGHALVAETLSTWISSSSSIQ